MTTTTPQRGFSASVNRPEDRSIGELLKELANETSMLVRQEMKLASAEMTHKVAYAGRQVAYIAAGGLLAVVALLTLVGALVFGLATMIPLWKSALLVGAILTVISVIAAWKGVAALRDMSMVPKKTIESIREDKQLVEQHVR
jgi:hypothetical protein